MQLNDLRETDMNLLTPEESAVELRRRKGVGQPMFSRVKKRQEYCVEIDSIYDDKILKKVAANPKFGAKRLSKILMQEGILLTPYAIYRCLIKFKLNHRSLRLAWKEI